MKRETVNLKRKNVFSQTLYCKKLNTKMIAFMERSPIEQNLLEIYKYTSRITAIKFKINENKIINIINTHAHVNEIAETNPELVEECCSSLQESLQRRLGKKKKYEKFLGHCTHFQIM